MYRMKIYYYMTLWLTFLGLASACSSEADEVTVPETTSVSFHVAMNMETRAAHPLDPKAYTAKLYLYERRQADNTVGYTKVQEIDVTSDKLTINGLVTQKQYKAVFLAVPSTQTKPALPDFTNGTAPAYDKAIVPYINGQPDEIGKDIFRSIVDFTARAAGNLLNTVLTRQNGAVEVRLLNQKDLKSVELHVNGHTEFYLNDGTGGQVIAQGTTVALKNTITDANTLNASEVRIRINLLPQEDLTDKNGTNNYLIVTTATGQTKYPLKSGHQTIPVYPNQITWLTLGSKDNSEFDVSFSGNINLDDNQWDGIHKSISKE